MQFTTSTWWKKRSGTWEPDEDEQQPPRGRRHHEEIRRHNLVDVIGQERPPLSGGRSSRAHRVFRDAGFTDLDAVEILRLISTGLNNQAIAERLFISEHTVHRHVANILTKLNASSRSAAVAQAGRLGLL